MSLEDRPAATDGPNWPTTTSRCSSKDSTYRAAREGCPDLHAGGAQANSGWWSDATPPDWDRAHSKAPRQGCGNPAPLPGRRRQVGLLVRWCRFAPPPATRLRPCRAAKLDRNGQPPDAKSWRRSAFEEERGDRRIWSLCGHCAKNREGAGTPELIADLEEAIRFDAADAESDDEVLCPPPSKLHRQRHAIGNRQL